MKLVINKCENLRKERNKLLNKLNEINNTNYDELLKGEVRNDNRSIKIIKEFILDNICKKFGIVNNKKDNE